MRNIRESKFSKIVVTYLIMMLLLELAAPTAAYALTSGPTQPEFNSFTPISTSDMVDLSSGDYNYNIPIMDVGGYPINLAYNSGVSMDQEASWVGLGWNLNVGQIERQMRGLPDDFRGDEMIYENDMRDNVTVGAGFDIRGAVFGVDILKAGVGLNVQYNNYEGITFKPSYGITYEINKNVSVGVNFSSSVADGATVSPSVSISGKLKDKDECVATKGSLSFGVGLNSRKGLESTSVSASIQKNEKLYSFDKGQVTAISDGQSLGGSSQHLGSISFNNISVTPSKKLGYDNKSFTFSAALGKEFLGVEAQGQITGYGSYQGIANEYKNRSVKAYGYENTQYKGKNEGVLDFNREKETEISPSTTALPVTNYTYDLYTIQGQGAKGMFRPYRSQVSHVYNDNIYDYGASGSFGLELGLAQLVHAGGNFNVSPTTTRVGRWNDGNNALPYFEESNNDFNKIDYEPFAYKLIGEMNVDNDKNYLQAIHNNKALRFALDGDGFNKGVANSLINNYTNYNYPLNTKIKREKRLQRNQVVQKITKEQAKYDKQIKINDLGKPHHTAGIKVLQPGGTTYVYGETVYNTKKVEATFDVSKQYPSQVRSLDGTVGYNGSVYGNGNGNSDHYVNKITTPAYAHSYLLTSVLSTDYEDLTNNGVTDDDLGNYTKFTYSQTNPSYKWRVPYEENRASYNEGLDTNKDDDKGNYLFGEKEIKYLNRIETKTHIAYFDLDDRKDAIGVKGEHGGRGSDKMKCLKSIRLYSKAELIAAGVSLEIGPTSSSLIKPIKTAHFEYNYSLCKGTPSTEGGEGKLTLTKVYFTYKGSNMGRFTPYVFTYSAFNPDYATKANDTWGNYAPLKTAGPTNSEFPFVEQDATKANLYSSAWNLKKVKLPSGGEITINTESDDYQYVQNKKAMQMFKVVGAGKSMNDLSTSPLLYTQPFTYHNPYIYVKLSDQQLSLTSSQFVDKYIGEMGSEVYFRFKMNMTDTESDYVSGYFNIKNLNIGIINIENDPNGRNGTYASIPVQDVHMGGGVNANRKVNPFSKAGWSFGRRYLNRYVYSLGGDGKNKSFSAIVKDLVGSLGAVFEIFNGPNEALENKGRAQKFDTSRSWIRLQNPDGKKIGGGLRVKSVELSDNWDVMTANTTEGNIYNQKYGQEYDYSLEGGKSSSGVATFEANGSPENPFVKPYYAKDGSFEDAIGTRNYIEEPFGEGFFPSPTVTYSRVSVSNIKDGFTDQIKKHSTGKVVTTFYTSKDFPTIVNKTDIQIPNNEHNYNIILFATSRNHIAASQGFSIETNDMNGKTKTEEVYQEGATRAISRVEYKYNVDSNGNLTNEFTTIDKSGNVQTNTLGVTYDMITDFNESKTNSQTAGLDMNLAVFLITIFPAFVPVPLPNYAEHETQLRTATITKTTHKTGVLIEKIAYDLDARVSTKNLAWDAATGDVLLTQTINEYNDNYYSFMLPAYWKYEGMGLAATNIDIEGYLQKPNGNCPKDTSPYMMVKANLSSGNLTNLEGLFYPGDELLLETKPNEPRLKVWVLGLNAAKTGLLLIDEKGNYIDDCGTNRTQYKFRLIRSGFRNIQNASMASITSMINPIKTVVNNGVTEMIFQPELFNYTGAGFNPRVINSNAVVYNDFWKPQLEGDLLAGLYPSNPNSPNQDEEVSHPYNLNGNPYLRNIKGDWRAQKSYAFLAGRNSGDGVINNPRNEGFFNRFSAFYQLQNGKWIINDTGWQFASSVTQFSPYGVELENKDALDRYSAAQYGHNYTLPMAVGSNARYNEIGFEGFEETNAPVRKHFGFGGLLANQTIASLVTTTQSHTGKRSVKVTKQTSVKLIRKLIPPTQIATRRTCQFICSDLKIEEIGTNWNSTNWVGADRIYYKYRLSTDCTSGIKISGTNTSIFEFEPDPANSNFTYLTIKKGVNYNPPTSLSEPSSIYVPVDVEGSPISLVFQIPTQGATSTSTNTPGVLKCPTIPDSTDPTPCITGITSDCGSGLAQFPVARCGIGLNFNATNIASVTTPVGVANNAYLWNSGAYICFGLNVTDTSIERAGSVLVSTITLNTAQGQRCVKVTTTYIQGSGWSAPVVDCISCGFNSDQAR